MKVTYKNRTLKKIGFISSIDMLSDISDEYPPIVISDKEYDGIETIQLVDDIHYREKRNEYNKAVSELEAFNERVNKYYNEYRQITNESISSDEMRIKLQELKKEYKFTENVSDDVSLHINKELSTRQCNVEQLWNKLYDDREKFIAFIIKQLHEIDLNRLNGRTIILDIDSPILSDIVIITNTEQNNDGKENPIETGTRITSNIIEAANKEGYFINVKHVSNTNTKLTQIDGHQIHTDINYLQLLTMNGITCGVFKRGTDELKDNLIERGIVNIMLKLKSFNLILKFSSYNSKDLPVFVETLTPSLYPIPNTLYMYPNCYMYYILKYLFPYCCSTSVIGHDNLSVI